MKAIVWSIVSFALATAAAPLHAQVLGLGTAPQRSIGYNMASAIAKVMAEAGLQSRV